MTVIRVSCSRDYNIYIGEDAVSSLPEAAAALNPTGAHIIADSNTARYIPKVISALASCGIAADSTIIPAGEEHKTPASAARICSRFASSGLDREGLVIALGGGVIGDLTGYCAATYMRGVRYIGIPTTLIALIDSSVGGKTAVDLPEGKNLVGAFWQPSAVISDTDFLKTLPEREITAGFGEVLKYYALGAAGLRKMFPIAEHFEEIVAICCAVKTGYVEHDERDNGARAALNLGHTFAHAIEKYYGYKDINHGEAVAIGVRLALQAGVLLGVTPNGVMSDVLRFAKKLKLKLSVGCEVRELYEHMGADKKKHAGKHRLVLLENIGSPLIYEIDEEALTHLLSSLNSIYDS